MYEIGVKGKVSD